MDSYTSRGNYEQGLMVANEALKSDSLNQLFLFAKSTMLLNLGRYAECLACSRYGLSEYCAQDGFAQIQEADQENVSAGDAVYGEISPVGT